MRAVLHVSRRFLSFLLRNTSVSACSENQNKKVTTRLRFISVYKDNSNLNEISFVLHRLASGPSMNLNIFSKLVYCALKPSAEHSFKVNANQTEVYFLFSLGSEVHSPLFDKRKKYLWSFPSARVLTGTVRLGVWKSGKPESGIGTGIGTGTGSGTGIGTGMGRETYIKTGTTFTLI